jgi:cellobiose phosphorylase
VWLAFFLYDVLMQFSKLAHQRGDDVFVAKCLLEAERLRANIEEHGWDGEWYRRAYFDDGTPLGSKSNTECQIDSISQSWSVLSGAGSNEKMVQAMTNLDRRLVRREERLIQLLDPPFDTSDLNPGYIKGYVPGVRENGGQYTHAAIWAVMAFAEMGETEKAWELFRLINPMTHGDTSAAISTYCVEPYVVAADVYAVPPHTGRGGWTWYTGSAGWMYRLITESLLGIRLEVDKLRFAPRVPAEWQSYKIYYVFRETTYHITVESHGSGNVVKRVRVDGVESDELIANLVDDRIAHEILVEIW